MFKLIGIIVVVAVVIIGFPSLQRWYAGDATPQETVKEMRDSVGQKLMTEEGDKSGKSSASGKSAAPATRPMQSASCAR